MAKPGALAKLDLEKVIERVAAGEFPAYIAKELNVSKVALFYKLKEHPRYKAALEDGTDMLLVDGLAELRAAGDDLNLARVREIQLRRLEWRAERLFPHRWGQRTHVTIDNVTDLADRLRRAKERDITPEAVQQLTEMADPVVSTQTNASVTDCPVSVLASDLT